MKLRHLLLTSIFAFFAVAPASALTLPVSEDTFSSGRGIVKKAAGKATTLSIDVERTAFIRFEAGSLSDSLAPADVTRAQVIFYIAGVRKSGDLTLHTIREEWSETATTAIQEPAIEASPFLTVPAASVIAKQFIIVDVTVQVRAWLANPAEDFGIAIRNGTDAKVFVASKEGAGSGHPATLEIERAEMIGDSKLVAGIDVAKLSDGVVDNGEFRYLDGVTSAIQSQLNSLAAALDAIGDATRVLETRLGNHDGDIEALQMELAKLSSDLDQVSSDLDSLSTLVSGKVSKAGDTMTGTLHLPLDGLEVGTDQLTISEGNVGVGTAVPTARLDVRGDVKLGADGQLYATGGEEKLRIVRGTIKITADGILVTAGSGFTAVVVKSPLGEHVLLTFEKPFTGLPTITVSRENSTREVYLREVTSDSAILNLAAYDIGASTHFIAIGAR